jgi:hypothetical protein
LAQVKTQIIVKRKNVIIQVGRKDFGQPEKEVSTDNRIEPISGQTLLPWMFRNV